MTITYTCEHLICTVSQQLNLPLGTHVLRMEVGDSGLQRPLPRQMTVGGVL
jgi:hypothetical protein